MRNGFLLYPRCLNTKTPLILILAVTLTYGCGGGSSADGPSQAPDQNSQQTNSFGNDAQNAQPAGSLTLNSDSLLIAATRKDLYKLSASDGSAELVFEGGGDSWEFLSPVDAANDVAYISSTDNILNAISLNTGELLWWRKLGTADEGADPTVPICSASSCYIIGAGQDLYNYGIPDGKRRWRVSLDRNGGAIQAIGSRLPLITEQKIYVGTDYADGSYRLNVYARNNGSLLKSIEFQDQIFGPPVLSDGKLLVVAKRFLYALDFSTYEPIWRTEFSGVSIPLIIDQTAIALIQDLDNQYIDSEFGTAGINIGTGKVIWANGMPLRRGVLPASDGSLVITAEPTSFGLAFSYPTYPRALNPADGSVVWELGTTGVTDDTPLAVPGYLFYRSISLSSSAFNTGVAALDSRTGEAIWTATNGYAETLSRTSAPIVLVHDGQVYRTEEFPTISK